AEPCRRDFQPRRRWTGAGSQCHGLDIASRRGKAKARAWRHCSMRMAAAAAVAAFCWGMAAAAEPVQFVAMGDVPYVWPRDGLRPEKLIMAANAAKPDFLVHVGDIKSGGTPCTEASYRQVLDMFAQSEAPLVYTPGD